MFNNTILHSYVWGKDWLTITEIVSLHSLPCDIYYYNDILFLNKGTWRQKNIRPWFPETVSVQHRQENRKRTLLLTMEYLESTSTFRENPILWSQLLSLPSSPPICKPPALSPAHLKISPLVLTPSIQSKPQSALAWIKELLGIPSVSILCVCLWECAERVCICVLPGWHILDWVLLDKTQKCADFIPRWDTV